MKKTRVQKSHATVPLNGQPHEIFSSILLHQSVHSGPITRRKREKIETTIGNL